MIKNDDTLSFSKSDKSGYIRPVCDTNYLKEERKDKKQQVTQHLIKKLATIALVSAILYPTVKFFTKSNSEKKPNNKKELVSGVLPDSDNNTVPFVEQNSEVSNPSISFQDTSISNSVPPKTKQQTPSISDNVFSQIQKHNTSNLNNETLRLYADTLTTLSGTNDIVRTLSLSPECCTALLDMCQYVPTNQLMSICHPEKPIPSSSNQSTNIINQEIERLNNRLCFSFDALSTALQTSNTNAILNEAFLLKCRYQTCSAYSEQASHLEDNKNFLYFCTALQPTVECGVNLFAYPEAAQYTYVTNSEFAQTNFNTDTAADYLQLNEKILIDMQTYTRNHNYTNHSANFFKKKYNLLVHPTSLEFLKTYREKIITPQHIVQAEKYLQKEAKEQSQEGSGLFGTQQNPVPLEAVLVAVDISYNSGSLKCYPRFSTAYVKRDYKTAGKESDSNGNEKRNDWRKTMLKRATSIKETSLNQTKKRLEGLRSHC